MEETTVKEQPAFKVIYESSSRPQGKILIVDDHRPNIMVTGALLEQLGYAYDAAYSGAEALEKIEQQSYALILMDIQMQGMDGFEVTRLIRERERQQSLPHTPIVAMTAYAMVDDRKKCLAAGMDDYLAKPFKESDLKRILGYFHETLAVAS